MNGDRRLEAAPGTSRAAAVAETHTATLFFVDDRVYKVKKRVRLPFLDFSTLERRGHACRREVELNRRIAPDVYLGVAEVSEPDGRAVDDYAVVMRRMPPERSLARLAERGDDDLVDQVREVARVVAAFHARAERPPDARQKAGVEAVRKHWHDNLDEMHPHSEGARPVFDGARLARARELVDTFLAGRAELLDQRAEAGFVCDGHGDLQAADIYCLDDGPRILDCIEFDDSLRVVDVADDVAFLAMDLERLDAATAAQAFVDSYGEFSGHPLPPPLVHHYIAYRAGVRAKVTALRVEQVAADTSKAEDVSHFTALARRLLDLCIAHLETSEVRLVLVGGLPGTGKTTLAEAIGAARDWPVVRSDVVRKELAGVDPRTSMPSEFGAGLYTAESTDAVYEELVRRAEVLLRTGSSVVLDASWTSGKQRDRARSVAKDAHARVVELRCAVDERIAAARMRSRMQRGTDASDATPEIASLLAAQADEWPESIEVVTDRPVEDLLPQVDRHL